MTFSPLRTERLCLRPLDAGDAAEMFAYRSDPSVARYQSWKPSTIREIEQFIARNGVNLDLPPDAWFQIAIAATAGTCIGDIGIHVTDEGRQAELGVTLAPAAQGRGLATEALTALITWLFAAASKHRIFVSIDPRNASSLALVQRLGFRKEAHFREALFIDGAWVDDVVFALLASDWPHDSNA